MLDVCVKSFLRRNKVYWLEEERCLWGGTWINHSLCTWITSFGSFPREIFHLKQLNQNFKCCANRGLWWIKQQPLEEGHSQFASLVPLNRKNPQFSIQRSVLRSSSWRRMKSCVRVACAGELFCRVCSVIPLFGKSSQTVLWLIELLLFTTERWSHGETCLESPFSSVVANLARHLKHFIFLLFPCQKYFNCIRDLCMSQW